MANLVPSEDLPSGLVPTEDLPDQATAREPSVADTIPYLNEANRFYEKVRGQAVPAVANALSKGLNFATGMQGAQTQAPIESAVNFMTPETLPEAALQAIIGKTFEAIPWAGSKLLSSFRGVRPVQRELAQEALGKLLTPEAKAAQEFYSTASKATEGVRAPTQMAKIGEHEFPIQLTQRGTAIPAQKGAKVPFDELHAALQDMVDKGAPHAEIQALKNTIEASYPGFKAAEKGYAEASNVSQLQKMTLSHDPLAALEKDLADNRVLGAGGETVRKGGKVTHYLNDKEIEDVRKIMRDLGPEPGNAFFKQMIEGRALGSMVGGVIGGQHGGIQGAAEGAAAGLGVPFVINKLLAKGLTNPAMRAFIKRSLASGGMANPHFWQALGAMGTRLGINMND